MSILSLCWLGSAFDPQDVRGNLNFERLLSPLYHHENCSDEQRTLDHLRAIEGKLLFGKGAASSRQSARYWFLAAWWYSKFQQPSAAFESYEMCSRVVSKRDSWAHLVIYTYWEPIAELLGFHRQAQHCHTMAQHFAQELAQKKKMPSQANEDNQFYLAIVAHRLAHLPDIGTGI